MTIQTLSGDFYTNCFQKEQDHEGRLILNMGPQHPSTHGVLRVIVELEGEYISRAEPVLGYLHRMHEKMGEVKTFHQYMPNMGRVDYLHALAWNWAFVEPEEIDRINILQASLEAMKRAVEALKIKPDYVIVDGPHPMPTHIPQTPIPKGDAKSQVIAAASIMAKVVRDSIMLKYHSLYPCYNFAGNKGYGTREHISALEAYGCCPIHRKSFKKVVSN